jgi:acetoacetyl-CoA synthetase
LPYTHNGKRSEKAARDAIHGADVVNADALRNPECLETIRAAVAAADGPDGDEPGPVATASQQVTTTSGTSALDLLTPLWCEVLGVPRVDPDDEFSDLGGTSRQAVQLLRRVALELAADVPIGTFYRRPTLRGLAEAVANARAGGVVRVPLLRQGNGAPLYVVADYLGQFNSYHRLVEGLTITRPVYGVAPSVLDEQGFRRPISQVVEETMELLQDHRPGGPYRLIGYSFGGLVAFEAAVRLRAAGETVAYLGLLDVHPPESLLTARELSAKRAATAARRLRKLMSREGAGATRTYVSARNPRGSDLELRLYHQSWDRFHAFRPSGPYDGAVTYYLARDRLLLVGNSLAAWRRVAAHLLVTEVPGSHGTLLDGTNVEELAARVSATLT